MMKLVFLVMIAYLKNLSATKKNVLFEKVLNKLFLQIVFSYRLLYLWNSFTCHDRLICYASSAQKQNITRNILMVRILIFLILGAHQLLRHFA